MKTSDDDFSHSILPILLLSPFLGNIADIKKYLKSKRLVNHIAKVTFRSCFSVYSSGVRTNLLCDSWFKVTVSTADSTGIVSHQSRLRLGRDARNIT